MEMKNNDWDAKNTRIKNVTPGINDFDCATVDQIPRSRIRER
jgi:hypothetical protein